MWTSSSPGSSLHGINHWLSLSPFNLPQGGCCDIKGKRWISTSRAGNLSGLRTKIHSDHFSESTFQCNQFSMFNRLLDLCFWKAQVRLQSHKTNCLDLQDGFKQDNTGCTQGVKGNAWIPVMDSYPTHFHSSLHKSNNCSRGQEFVL